MWAIVTVHCSEVRVPYRTDVLGGFASKEEALKYLLGEAGSIRSYLHFNITAQEGFWLNNDFIEIIELEHFADDKDLD